MHISIHESRFEPWKLVAEYQSQHITPGKYGATAVFVGSMRDMNEGDQVQSMTLEHYPGMTEKYLEKISQEARERWDILDTLIAHRVGDVLPDDSIVVVAVWASHRAHAYEANRYLMEQLKSNAPFWKKETLLSNQQRWVEKNTSGEV